MAVRKIHCPICHGSGKISDVNHGKITCLNCVGTGIVDLDIEQQKIIENINKQKKEQNSTIIISIVVAVFVAVFAAGLIFVIVYYWDEIINFLWEIIKGIFYIVLGIVILVGMFKAFSD